MCFLVLSEAQRAVCSVTHILISQKKKKKKNQIPILFIYLFFIVEREIKT